MSIKINYNILAVKSWGLTVSSLVRSMWVLCHVPCKEFLSWEGWVHFCRYISLASVLFHIHHQYFLLLLFVWGSAANYHFQILKCLRFSCQLLPWSNWTAPCYVFSTKSIAIQIIVYMVHCPDYQKIRVRHTIQAVVHPWIGSWWYGISQMGRCYLPTQICVWNGIFAQVCWMYSREPPIIGCFSLLFYFFVLQMCL